MLFMHSLFFKHELIVLSEMCFYIYDPKYGAVIATIVASPLWETQHLHTSIFLYIFSLVLKLRMAVAWESIAHEVKHH